MYEEALTKLKSEKRISSFSLKPQSKFKADQKTLQSAFSKAKSFVNDPESDLILASVEEANIVCEALRQIYLKEKTDLYQTFTNINERIKDLEELYMQLQDLGNSVKDDGSQKNEIGETPEDVQEAISTNPFSISSEKQPIRQNQNLDFSNRKQILNEEENSNQTILQNKSDIQNQNTKLDEKSDNFIQRPINFFINPQKEFVFAQNPRKNSAQDVKVDIHNLKGRDLKAYFLGNSRPLRESNLAEAQSKFLTNASDKEQINTNSRQLKSPLDLKIRENFLKPEKNYPRSPLKFSPLREPKDKFFSDLTKIRPN